jgi:hypothetical protein
MIACFANPVAQLCVAGIAIFRGIILKQLTKVAICVAASLCAVAASAQNSNTSNSYLGFEFGSYQFKDQNSLATGLVSALGGSATSVQDSGMTVGKIFGGMNLTENFGVEVGYIMTGSANATFSGVSGSAVAYSGTASIKASGLDFSGLIRPGTATGLNGLFLRLGGHSMTVKNEVSVLTGSSSGASSTSNSGTGGLIGVGYDGKINDKLDFRVAYTSYSTIGGVSGNNANLFSVGLVSKF